MSWIWDDIKKFFQNVASTVSQIFGFGELVNLRDEFTDKVMLESDALMSRLLSDGTINIQDWVVEMRGLIRDTYRAMYELAIGGRQNMTPADYGRLGGMLQEQYRYLDRFAADLAEGRLTLPQALNRARMYIESATQAFERAQAAGWVSPCRSTLGMEGLNAVRIVDAIGRSAIGKPNGRVIGAWDRQSIARIAWKPRDCTTRTL
jgi:hypothetical protein